MAKKDVPKTKMSKDIGIAYEKPILLSVADLHDLQGDLKELSEENFAKLSKEIINTGFAFSPHVWRNPKDKKYYIVDGNQRVKTIRRLMHQSGFRIPKIPVIPVQAKTENEAKRRILQAASQYGEVIPQGLFEFMKDADLKFPDFKASFEFPTINLDKFTAFFEKPPEKKAEGSKEIKGGEFTKLVHTCPSCGHKFSRE